MTTSGTRPHSRPVSATSMPKHMHDMTTTCTMSYQCETKNTMDHQRDESDAESFHSAISTVTKPSSRQRSTKACNNVIGTSITIKHNIIPTRPRSKTTCSLKSPSSQNSQSNPRSKTPRHDLVPIPNRRSSLPQRKYRPRKDSAALHSQSCKLFSSLDGMLAISRDTTPLRSMSTSRTTTRQASLVPDGTYDSEAINRVCQKLDARLASAADFGEERVEDPYAYSYSDVLPSGSPSTSPTLPSGFDPQISENSLLLSRSVTAPTAKSQQRPHFNTVISWTSNATRRTEYEKIDRAQKGARGLVRRVWPQCMRKRDGRKAFFTGECDGDSVRRFRMDVSDDDSDGEDGIRHTTDDDIFDEKHALEHEYAQTTESTVKRGESRNGGDTKTKKPWWSCFET